MLHLSFMKQLFLLCLMLGIVSQANSQDITFGVKGGLVSIAPTFEFPGIEVSGSEIGFTIGAFARKELNDQFAIQPELLYQTGGGISFLQLPVMFQFHVMEALTIDAGPQIGLVLNGFDGDGLFDTSDVVKDLQFSIGIGTSYHWSDNFFTDLRYNLALNNLYDGEGDGTVKYGIIALSAGYKF